MINILPTRKLAITEMLRDPKMIAMPVIDRVTMLRLRGYNIERVRHYGSRVGDFHTLKSGERRVAIDAPRGKYRTAWSIIYPPFAKLKLFT